MKKIFNIIICLLVASASLLAQTKTTIQGVVTDAKGVPVIGAVVMLEGNTSIGVTTDVDGKYSITIPVQAGKKSVLNVSCISYLTQSIDVAGRAKIDIVLQDDAEELEEVVVVGYGAMRKSDLTGSVASVKINEDDAAQSSSLDQLLQGKAAGVQVLSNNASPDAGVNIRVRGLSSFNGGSEPLYVVDGIILNVPSGVSVSLMTKGQDNSGSDEAVNGLMGINPQDIASMEILKDASATAIYGALGANGVVLITTKTATKDRPTVNVSIGTDVSRRTKKLDILGFEDYIEYMNAKGQPYSNIYEDPVNKTGLKVEGMDWQDYLMQTAVSQRYYVSIQGRPKTLSYLFSLSYNNKEGIIKQSGFDQYTVRLNLDKTITKNLKVGTKTNLAYVNSNLTQGANTGRLTNATSMMRSMTSSRPYRSLNAADDLDEDEEGYKSTPDKWLTDFRNTREEFRLTSSVYADWKIAKWLSFKSTASTDLRSYELSKYKTYRINTTAEGSIGAVGHVENLNYNIDNTFNFNKKFRGGHNLSGTVGMTLFSNTSNTQTIEGWNIDQYKAFLGSMNSAPNTRFDYAEGASATLSYFARAIYNYKDRYVLTATFRADGSSKFQGANKWAYFPSFAFAWRINQEPWFNLDAVSLAKARVGWGRVGNQAVSNYQTLSTFASTSYPDHSTGNTAEVVRAIYPNNLANPDLKWETTETVNAGIDLGFFQGRLALSVDAYNKLTYDLLQQKLIAISSGFTKMWMNQGTIQNRGLEFTLDATPVKAGDLEWGINGNISFNRNKIVEIGPSGEVADIYLADGNGGYQLTQKPYFLGDSIGTGSYACGAVNVFIQGMPMGLFYGYKTDGLVQEGETGPSFTAGTSLEPGSVKYVDVDGDGTITTMDRTIIGNPNPDFTFGFGTNLSYKRFDLSMNFIGSYGNDIYNVNWLMDSAVNQYARNVVSDAYFNAWTPENTDTRYPALDKFTLDDVKQISDRAVEDGSYLRLSKLTLSYDFPMKKNWVVKKFSAAVSGGNLWCWTKYSGWDPDVNSFGSNVKRMGADVGSYPSARTVSVDLKFTF